MGFERIEGFEVTPAVAEALEADAITEPTSVQQSAIEPVLAGRHVVIQSGTGTGKTLAYLLPILQRLRQAPDTRCVIFAPSAELAMQALRVAERYKDPSIATGSLVGSGGVTKSTRLIVGTPGRILEMYAARKLKRVTTIVLDEPDPILANEDADFLREVLSRPEPKVQLVIAAATMGPSAEQLVQKVMKPDFVRAQGDNTPLQTSIAHHFVSVRQSTGKEVCLARFVQDNRCQRAIVFANQDHAIRHLYRYLSEHDLRPVSLHSECPRQERKKAVAAFTESEARILITNDAAARGLDVPNVEWVLHYDLPHSAPAYVHRAGRTGRAGMSGHSIVFVSEDKRGVLKRYGKELGIRFAPFERPGKKQRSGRT